MTEREDIIAIKEGSRDAFRVFMDNNIDNLYRLVFKIVPVEDEARDIVQESFIKVWEKRITLRENNSILSWLRRIAINRCYDYLRKAQRLRRYEGNRDENEESKIITSERADDIVSNEEYKKIITTITSTLSPKQRLVFTLSVVERFSHEEISGVTGLTKNSIKSNLHHAKLKVKKYAEKYL